ncbi:hypothetical protein BESB_046800 [Besnoitia besnoiti]|uniref:Uncharacterized protein n=1 Tax=Besnoitia besnoiti TaxID=94643 RepID=A0A2A9MDB4_BESBE|nr:hypothetical protein BESB_046800 [Besnoitia besnoiti]PFH36488.1 hypothetical protein BESB_046800 [Besnoitia besnoiti]
MQSSAVNSLSLVNEALRSSWPSGQTRARQSLSPDVPVLSPYWYLMLKTCQRSWLSSPGERRRACGGRSAGSRLRFFDSADSCPPCSACAAASALGACPWRRPQSPWGVGGRAKASVEALGPGAEGDKEKEEHIEKDTRGERAKKGAEDEAAARREGGEAKERIGRGTQEAVLQVGGEPADRKNDTPEGPERGRPKQKQSRAGKGEPEGCSRANNFAHQEGKAKRKGRPRSTGSMKARGL